MKFSFFSSSNTTAIGLLLITVLFGCYSGDDKDLATGLWRGTLQVQQKELPFNFEVTRIEPMSYQIHLINGEERISTSDVRIMGDSMFASMHIFDTELQVRFTKHRMNGYWVKNYTGDYIVPFRARLGESYRFEPGAAPVADVSGKWQVKFSNDSLPGLGIFEQQDTKVVGTFLTGSGDYRYLEGAAIGDSLFLSAFDGEHAFLFNARVDEGTMDGEFISGIHFRDSWTAIRNARAIVVNPDSITYLKPGYERIDFAFPDLNGRTVSLSDQRFEGKILILQLFGSWCPNCMDETIFLSNWYNANRGQPVEIIGLAYEKLDDFTYAKNRLNRLALKFDVNYEILVAGTSDKQQASQTLPMLSQINAFPTTIFIDHKGEVRKIHTGFKGPGTGEYHRNYVTEFENLIKSLVVEKLTDTVSRSGEKPALELLVP